MQPKFGSSQNKPSLSQDQRGKAGSGDDKGLQRKGSGSSRKQSYGRKSDAGKLYMGDIAEDQLEDALLEVDTLLEQAPKDAELHKRKYRILRKMDSRQKMRASLQAAARACGDSFFGVKLAEAYEEEGVFNKALEWRKWVAQFYPDDADSTRRLAVTAVRAFELKFAESTYQKLIELRKHDSSPLGGTFFEEMLGRNFNPEQRKKLQHMGLRLVARALTHQGDNPSLLESAARLSYKLNELEASMGFYERALQTTDEHRNLHQWKMELLRVYAKLGKQHAWHRLSQSFMEELSEHVQENRGDSRAWTILAKQQVQAGYFEKAINTLKQALYADSKNAQAAWELGRLYVRMGQSQEAIDYYRSIIQDPNERISVKRAIERSLADLYFRTGRFQDALDIYLQDSDGNLRLIAPIYEVVGQTEDAGQLYELSVQRSPRDARCHLGMAEFYVRRERWEDAEKAGELGLGCNYATEEVHSQLSVTLATAQMRQNKMNEALATINKVCEAYPDSIQQLFRKVKLLLLLNRREEAMELAGSIRTTAIHQTECAPASSALWSLLGDCHSLLGEVESAHESYSNSLKYDFMDSIAVRGLGIVAEKMNDLPKALELYRRFTLLDPLNLATPAIKSRIQELEQKIAPEVLANVPSLQEEAPQEEDSFWDQARKSAPLPQVNVIDSLTPHTSEEDPPISAFEPEDDWLGDSDPDRWYE